jgi:3',5'-cyclic AMP phosphodiesterase CpdA
MTPSDHEFKFALIADTHIRPHGESSSPWKTNLLTNDRARWVTRKVTSHKPDLIIHLGDIVHPVPHLPTYNSAIDVARNIFGESVAPVYYVPGNHDIGDKENPTVPAYTVNDSYIENFNRLIGPTYQSFDHKGVHFILINSPVLNSGRPEESEQKKWLEKDLKKNKGRRIFVFSHYPPYLYQLNESNNYDNIDLPARKWLIALCVKYNVETFFAGHVHQYGYKKYEEMRIYNLLSTCFVRQDFSELFRIGPADEYGRNDNAKLGYALVYVDDEKFHIKLYRSYGKTLKDGGDLPEISTIQGFVPFEQFNANFGVHYRHPFVEITDLPYMAPIDEFVRKRTRNDYPQLALNEACIRTIRLPLEDLKSPEIRLRLIELQELGHRYGFFSVNVPNTDLVWENREIIDFLEVILPWENIEESLPGVSQLRKETDLPVYLGNIESSIHKPKKGPKFSHYISHGFRFDELDRADLLFNGKPVFNGLVFQVSQSESPLERIKEFSGYVDEKICKALVNVKLSSEDPAEYIADDNIVANRAAESLIASYAYPKVKVFLDTFIDHDRGYFPRTGLYDRRINPRKGGKVVKNLQTALMMYGPDINFTKITGGKYRQIFFESKRCAYVLSLSDIPGNQFNVQKGSTIINLESGEYTKEIGSFSQILEVIQK